MRDRWYLREVHSLLSKRFKGDLLRPGDAGYDDARTVWNGMVSRSPRLIARCADLTDVQMAVKAASAARLLTAIRCGGHSLAGFGTCDGGSANQKKSLIPGATRAWRCVGLP